MKSRVFHANVRRVDGQRIARVYVLYFIVPVHLNATRHGNFIREFFAEFYARYIFVRLYLPFAVERNEPVARASIQNSVLKRKVLRLRKRYVIAARAFHPYALVCFVFSFMLHNKKLSHNSHYTLSIK